MNRRGFLQSALAAVTALAIDPEELVWTPKKTIFIPKPKPPLSLSALQREMYGKGLKDMIVHIKDMRLVVSPAGETLLKAIFMDEWCREIHQSYTVARHRTVGL